MVFSSLVFLGLFLPIILLVYHSTLYATRSLKIANKVVLVGSLFFYSWGEPLWVAAMLFTATVDYVNGRRIGATKSKTRGKIILASSIFINIGILFMFKYLGFVTGAINGWAGLSLPVFSLAMPIGISFYTFQSLSYVIDVYRGKAQVQRNYFNYLLYVSMFPQLVAGPIVRYVDVEQQIGRRVMTFSGFAGGVRRFCVGMGKKVILANTAGAAVVTLLGGDLAEMSVAGAWLGALFYAFQIYFDFSGYSDMAIGLGKMFGFEYKENFNYPYVSRSITEFWRRWHMSLSGFFRDYLYIPLGGNRRLQLRNILVVWFLTGLWHGASWNFICWGLYYGVLLLAEKHIGRLFRSRQPDVLPVVTQGARANNEPLPAETGAEMGSVAQMGGTSPAKRRPGCAGVLAGALRGCFGWVFTMLVVLYGWGIFYFTDSGALVQFTKVFFLIDRGGGLIDMLAQSTFFQHFWMFPIFAIGSTPLAKLAASGLKTGLCRIRARWLFEGLEGLALAGILGLCFLFLVGGSYNPFLYFRF